MKSNPSEKLKQLSNLNNRDYHWNEANIHGEWQIHDKEPFKKKTHKEAAKESLST